MRDAWPVSQNSTQTRVSLQLLPQLEPLTALQAAAFVLIEALKHPGPQTWQMASSVFVKRLGIALFIQRAPMPVREEARSGAKKVKRAGEAIANAEGWQWQTLSTGTLSKEPWDVALAKNAPT